MSPIIDRLLELRIQLDHLREVRPRVKDAESLSDDLSLRNDVLHTLQLICQIVIDIASELSARRRLRFEDYSQAVENLATFSEFPAALVQRLEKLPKFRNVLVHLYVSLDYSLVIHALDRLDDIEEFAEAVRRIEGTK